jgi:hypothetical protein
MKSWKASNTSSFLFFINKEQMTCHPPIHTGKKKTRGPTAWACPRSSCLGFFKGPCALEYPGSHAFCFIVLVDFFKKNYPLKSGLYFVIDFFFQFHPLIFYWFWIVLCNLFQFAFLLFIVVSNKCHDIWLMLDFTSADFLYN